jgi:hypothetical protein
MRRSKSAHVYKLDATARQYRTVPLPLYHCNHGPTELITAATRELHGKGKRKM